MRKKSAEFEQELKYGYYRAPKRKSREGWFAGAYFATILGGVIGSVAMAEKSESELLKAEVTVQEARQTLDEQADALQLLETALAAEDQIDLEAEAADKGLSVDAAQLAYIVSVDAKQEELRDSANTWSNVSTGVGVAAAAALVTTIPLAIALEN